MLTVLGSQRLCVITSMGALCLKVQYFIRSQVTSKCFFALDERQFSGVHLSGAKKHLEVTQLAATQLLHKQKGFLKRPHTRHRKTSNRTSQIRASLYV